MGRGGSESTGVMVKEWSLPRPVEAFRYYRGEEQPEFSQQSERLVAELLERFRIPWQYEPHTFALERDEAGTVRNAFRPDFYLPEQGIYIEVSVMRSEYRNRKNRKIRLAKEIYGIKVKRCYSKQLQWLAARYGFDPLLFAAHSPLN